MKEIAIQFGKSLDQDDFQTTEKLLSENCKYYIGSDLLIGPVAICASYEQNMIEGRNKLDQLEWGESEIETIGEREFYVHFTDYLTHKGRSYVHKCKQKLTINEGGKITAIQHIDDPEEAQRLNEYYIKVGINKKE